MNHIFNHIQGHISGAFRPRLLPTVSQASDDPSASIIALFGSGEKGWLYDFSDLTTFYSDDTLTTPATVNGTVGSIRDKSPNLLHATQTTSTSRAILRGTPTGANLWTAYGTPGAGWVDSGSGVATATLSNAAMPTTTAATIGRVYRITYTMTRTVGTLTPSMGGVSLTARSTAGTYTDWITATSTAVLTFTGSATYSGAVSAVDVRDVSAGSVTAPYALQSDGVDDGYATASQDWSGGDAVTISMGAQPFADSTAPLCEFSANSASGPGRFALLRVSGGFTFRTRGAASSDASGAPSPAASVVAAVGIGDISSDTSVLRLNGVEIATSATDQGASNYIDNPFYFLRRGGASLPYAGVWAGGVCISRALTVGELAAVESWQTARLPT